MDQQFIMASSFYIKGKLYEQSDFLIDVDKQWWTLQFILKLFIRFEEGRM